MPEREARFIAAVIIVALIVAAIVYVLVGAPHPAS